MQQTPEEIGSDGRETEYGQFQRWMRQAPDLFERHQALVGLNRELLAALKGIVDIANETIDGLGIRYTFDLNSPLGKAARAVIAKAEGREAA